MEFFGITEWGPQNYVQDVMNDYFVEPKNLDDVKPMMQKVLERSTYPKTFERPDVDVVRTIDVYTGRVDGFSYGSTIRFNLMKKKGVLKPVYPGDMYRFAPTTSIENGWFYSDPALEGKVWYKCRPRHPAHLSEMTRIIDTVKKNDKYATLY